MWQRFRGLQNYTTLKPTQRNALEVASFRGLQNYTTLKPQGSRVTRATTRCNSVFSLNNTEIII